MRKLVLALMLSVLLLGFGIAYGAGSALDNVPGGAGVAYVQASPGGWQSLINIQTTDNDEFGRVHLTLWDGDSNHIYDWSICLTPYDNYGVVVSASDATGGLLINDYSDGYTPANAVPDISMPGLPVTFATYTSNGISYGYLTVTHIAEDDVSCVVVMTDDDWSDTDPTTNWDNNLFIRQAWVGPAEAMALNAEMLQQFVNYGTNGFDEASYITPLSCSMNFDADSVDIFGSIDDGVGLANIDWYELFIAEPGAELLYNDCPGLVTDRCCPVNALGAGYWDQVGTVMVNWGPRYWARWNDGGGLETVLVTVAPDLTNAPSDPNFNRYSHMQNQAHQLFDDAETPSSVSTLCQDEVCYTNFGPLFNELHIGLVEAGEVRLNIPYPIFGFVYTESSSYADIYPIITETKAVWNWAFPVQWLGD